jgi:hypothetical protein
VSKYWCSWLTGSLQYVEQLAMEAISGLIGDIHLCGMRSAACRVLCCFFLRVVTVMLTAVQTTWKGPSRSATPTASCTSMTAARAPRSPSTSPLTGTRRRNPSCLLCSACSRCSQVVALTRCTSIDAHCTSPYCFRPAVHVLLNSIVLLPTGGCRRAFTGTRTTSGCCAARHVGRGLPTSRRPAQVESYV